MYSVYERQSQHEDGERLKNLQVLHKWNDVNKQNVAQESKSRKKYFNKDF